MTTRAKSVRSKAAVIATATVNLFIPRKMLLPYQDKWSYDDSRFKIGLMARQVGKDHSSGEEVVHTIKRAEERGEVCDWLIAAPSERQSIESLNKVKDWSRVYDLGMEQLPDVRHGGGSEALLKQASVVFPKMGSSVIAVPGKPETTRGFSRNVLLTEFAFFENQEETWRSVLPSITNPLRGGPKRARVISTPNGKGDKFHSLWTRNFNRTDADVKREADSMIPAQIRARMEEAIAAAPKAASKLSQADAQMKWSCHRVTIYDAVRQGLPVNLFELYAGVGQDDPEGWAQEYECDFLDSSEVLLPYELIAKCESAECSVSVPFEYWQVTDQRPLFMGWDFARKRDLSVPWTFELVGDVLVSREMIEMRGVSTPSQVERMRPTIRCCQRVAIDYTGPGIGIGDYLVAEFGEWNPDKHLFGKIQLCTFTNDFKVKAFARMRTAFEAAKVRVPVNREIREDLHSLYRVATASGGVTYRAPHSEDGHADRSTACALAIQCVESGSGRAPEMWTMDMFDDQLDRARAVKP